VDDSSAAFEALQNQGKIAPHCCRALGFTSRSTDATPRGSNTPPKARFKLAAGTWVVSHAPTKPPHNAIGASAAALRQSTCPNRVC